MNEQVKAIFLDIDGTLLPGGRWIPTDRVLETLHKAQKAGHKIFINTGRSLANMPKGLAESFPFDGFVCGCGSYVILDGKVIHQSRLSVSVCCKLAEIFLSMPDDYWCYFEGERDLFGIHMPWDIEGLQIITSPRDFWEKFDGRPINKVDISYRDSSDLKHLLQFGKDITVYTFPSQNYAEIITAGNSKAVGIDLVMKALHLPLEQSIAVGDSSNDMDMIRHAGFSIAMGNGSDEVKKAADMVADTCENDGVAYALEKYLGL